MKIYVCIWIVVLMCLSHWCYGKTDVFNTDTAWIVNYKYSQLERDTFDFSLTIPKHTDPLLQYNYVRVFWGDHAADGSANMTNILQFAQENNLRHKYPTGIYYLVIKYYKNMPFDSSTPGDMEVCRVIFNQRLKGSISITSGTDGCIESGVDTFVVRVNNHKMNPPGTKYSVLVRSDAPGKDSWKVDPEPSQIKDSAFIIFSKPTGTFGADVRFRMIYKEDPKSSLSISSETDWTTLRVYGKPNLKEIFNFSDSLGQGVSINDLKNIESCTGQELTDLRYDSLVNVKYMYQDGLPVYSSRYNFSVEYFRKDSVNQREWINVTTDSTIVDTVNMKFNYPGFYKIRMVAYNTCGLDSLITDSVKGYDEKRYIQIYQGGDNVFRCEQDTICGVDENGVQITFMDCGKRFDWDPIPEYTWGVTRTLNGVPQDSVILQESALINLYRNGNIFEFDPNEQIGCDSASLKIKLYEPGTYKIDVRRTRFCDPPVTHSYTVTIGNPPGLPIDTLWKQLGTTPGLAIHKCDTFKYQLPEIRIDTNNMDIDSIQWCFAKKSQLDTIYGKPGIVQVYRFDSIGDQRNYISLRAHNYCGWSGEEKAELITDTRPKVVLWRDSVPVNDSLCVGFKYKYHWDGTLPTEYAVRGLWSKKVQVNGGTTNPDIQVPFASTETDEPKVGEVMYYQKWDKVYETFEIRNLNNPECAQKIKDSVVILELPNTILSTYKDTIRHCEDFILLDTKILFDSDSSPQFKYIEWKLNSDPVIKKTLPLFNPIFTLNSSEIDTLSVKTANSEGCYIKKVLILEPQVKPFLEFYADQTAICAEDTIRSADYIDAYIKTSNIANIAGMSLKLYKDKLEQNSLLYDTTGITKVKDSLFLNHGSQDTLRLIYEMKNNRMTEGFGDCILHDTIIVKIWKPVLSITGSDTISDISMNKYDFAHLGGHVKIDTANLVGQIAWDCIGGLGNFANKHDLKTYYTLDQQDKLKDYLEFELSGETPCGVVLKDTLIVYLPKEELHANTDTICNNDLGYTLWDPEHGKTYGKFINPATLEWKILPQKDGKIWGQLIPAPAIGSNVKYVPELGTWQADTVKIEVKAWNIYDDSKVGKTLIDTVLLKVNRKPVNVYPDTLYLKASEPPGRFIPFSDIAVFRAGATSINDAYCRDMSWSLVGEGAEGIGAAFVATDNGSGFNIGTPPGKDNYVADLSVTLAGLKGCSSISANVVLTGIMPPKVKLSNYDLCDSSTVRVDTGCRVQAKDKFTTLQWSHNGKGNFDTDFSSYLAAGSDTITAVTVKASKQFQLYTGMDATYQETASGSVHLYRAPDFSLCDGANKQYTYDTLCVGVSLFQYERDWVDANYLAANYGKENLKADKSVGLTGNFPNFTLLDGVDQARLIVTTDFGNCKKWQNVGDTLYITKLKKMTGDFDVPNEICAGSSFIVGNVIADPMCKSFSWMAEGGTIDQTNLRQPEFFAGNSRVGAVSMVVVPPHNCVPTETIKKTFLILEKPSLVLKDTTICKGSNFTINFVRHAWVGSIEWKANGRIFATTTTESVVSYVFNPVDVVGGVIKITGEITPEIPCSEKISSNIMTVSLQDAPTITGALNGVICQGDSLVLDASLVGATNQGNALWKLNGSGGQLENTADINTRYFPGEISGNQTLSLTVAGLHGCPSVSKNINIRVNKSELPAITVPDIRCVGSELIFSHLTTGNKPADAEGKWFVNNDEEGSRWYTFAHTFAAAGEYEIRFTTTYNGICPRSAKQTITLNPLPVTSFSSQPDSILGSGNEILFKNTTLGTVTYNWNFYGKGTMVSDEGGIYTHRFDLVNQALLFTKVTLTVTDANGCSASKTKGLKVVGVPVAKFGIESFDRCTGQTVFKNLSQGENISFYWDLGNGFTSVDTVPKGIVYTPVAMDSTYRIILKVKSEGGENIYEDSVKVISTLAPKFIITPDKEGCEGRQLSKGFANRTKGQAETYTFSWGDGTPNQVFTEFYTVSVLHKFSNPETIVKKFIIEMEASNECHSLKYKDSVRIYPNVINTEFVPTDTRICFGNEITFSNESFGFGPGVEAWWFFENDVAPEVNNDYKVVHRFNKPGAYPVRLAMTDRCNTDTSEVVGIYVLGDLSLAFGTSEGPYCSGQQIEMKLLPGLKNKFTNLHWDWGDGHSDNGLDSLKKRYNNVGTYEVRLSGNSISEGNCPVTTAKTIINVHETPYAAITPITDIIGCAPYTVDKFVRVGTGNERVFWDFKNGATSMEPAVTNVTFKDVGEYRVLLRLTSVDGCIDTAVKLVTVKETPIPQFTISDSLFCTPNGNFSIGLENKTFKPELSSFEWSYNGKQLFSRDEKPGTLSVTDEFGSILLKLRATHRVTGCPAEIEREAISGHRVAVRIGMDTTACFGKPMLIKNLSEYADRVEWDLGDGAQRTDDTLTYEYDNPGKYHLKMKAISDSGCKDSLKRWVIVYPMPVADFSFDESYTVADLKLPEGIDISNLPKVPNGGINFTNHSYIESYDFASNHLNAFWNFADGSEITILNNPVHTFKNNGQYPVMLLVKSNYGCADSVSEIINIDAVKGLFVPNAFAPDAGVLENPGVALFQPKGIGLLQYKIQVYDEWGTCVWSSDKIVDGHPAEGWDGTFNGKPLPKSTYLWKASAIFIDGSVWEGEKGITKGHVMLIR